VTDGLDGFLARYLNQHTPLGTFLDPLADKLLVVSFLVGLTLIGNIPLWFTLVLLSRDGVIAIGTFVLFSKITRREISPTFIGKTATVFAFGVVLLTLFELGTHSHFWKKMARAVPSLLVVTLGFSLYSAGQYVAHSLKEIREAPSHS
jgi:cardiolipin synthase